jgi:hypothetical protein
MTGRYLSFIRGGSHRDTTDPTKEYEVFFRFETQGGGTKIKYASDP